MKRYYVVARDIDGERSYLDGFVLQCEYASWTPGEGKLRFYDRRSARNASFDANEANNAMGNIHVVAVKVKPRKAKR